MCAAEPALIRAGSLSRILSRAMNMAADSPTSGDRCEPTPSSLRLTKTTPPLTQVLVIPGSMLARRPTAIHRVCHHFSVTGSVSSLMRYMVPNRHTRSSIVARARYTVTGLWVLPPFGRCPQAFDTLVMDPRLSVLLSVEIDY